MLTIRHRTGRGSAIAALLLSLSLFLGACGGAATPSLAPAATTVSASPTTVAAAPTATTVPATPTAAPATPTQPIPATPDTPSGSPAAALSTPVATVSPPTATPVPPTATPVPRAGQPIRVKIPVIRVDAAVEYVGLTPEGAMDVPKDYSKTAWYEPGPRPGEPGNAAIAGHVDSKTGKAVFWDLHLLKAGDEIFVLGDDGVERRFVVSGVQSYGRTDAPLQQIFGPTSERHLNIITCDSSSNFDRTKGEYAANIVVYTTYTP
ncbi:MAG TPA: class F sortase [Thermomicrobiales bacterium]